MHLGEQDIFIWDDTPNVVTHGGDVIMTKVQIYYSSWHRTFPRNKFSIVQEAHGLFWLRSTIIVSHRKYTSGDLLSCSHTKCTHGTKLCSLSVDISLSPSPLCIRHTPSNANFICASLPSVDHHHKMFAVPERYRFGALHAVCISHIKRCISTEHFDHNHKMWGGIHVTQLVAIGERVYVIFRLIMHSISSQLLRLRVSICLIGEPEQANLVMQLAAIFR